MSLRSTLPHRLPFFYGWVIVGCAMLGCYARQGASVANLSIFVTPMTDEFGWSRTAISGAVSPVSNVQDRKWVESKADRGRTDGRENGADVS